MVPGLYSAATALNAASQNQDAIAGNLANVSVPGYRRQGLAFQSVADTLDRAGMGGALGTQVSKPFTVFKSGPLQHTGNRLDLAVKGDGFFVLQGPDGPLYTRAGVFSMNARGELVSASGYPVASSNGTIVIPPAAPRYYDQHGRRRVRRQPRGWPVDTGPIHRSKTAPARGHHPLPRTFQGSRPTASRSVCYKAIGRSRTCRRCRKWSR